MKRIFIIVLIAQTILILMCIVYAMVQQTAAVKAQKEAVANFELAQSNVLKAQHQAERAEILETELALCVERSKKVVKP